jgi:hypothetical protein
MRAFSITLVSCACFAAIEIADDAKASQTRAALLANFLDSQTFAVLYVDLNRLDVKAAFQKLAEARDLRPGDLDDDRQSSEQFVAQLLKAGAGEVHVLFDLADLPRNGPAFVVTLTPGADEPALTKLLRGETQQAFPAGLPTLFQGNTCVKLHGALVSASPSVVRRLSVLGPNLDRLTAFPTIGASPIEMLLVPTGDMLRVADEMVAAHSTNNSAATPDTLRRGFRWGIIAVDSDFKPRFQIQSHDARSARALQQWIKAVLAQLGADPTIRRMYPAWEKVMPEITPNVSGDRLELELASDRLKDIVGPAMTQARYRFDWSVASRKLREIGLALHNYHDAKGHFPPAAIADKAGKRLLSWRVAILPYLDQQKLYNEFHLDEPWDSDHNKKLIARMPDVFASTAKLARQGKTSYLGVAGKSAMFPPDLKPVSIRDVIDGTSNTIWVVDVDDAHTVVWTKPDDFNYDPKEPSAGLVGHLPRGFACVFVDDSAHFVPQDIDRKTLNALYTRNGREIVRFP